jgi:hypothetical protein
MDPRETYEKSTGLSIDSTYSEIMNIEGWDGDEELTWAEWGYVNWLEAQNARLTEQSACDTWGFDSIIADLEAHNTKLAEALVGINALRDDDDTGIHAKEIANTALLTQLKEND